MRRIILSVLYPVLLVFSTASFADTIYMLSGDRISGKIKSADAEHIVVSTEYGGEISIKRTYVQSFESTETITLILTDDNHVTGKIRSGDSGYILIESDLSEDAQTIPIQQINTVYAGSFDAYKAEREKTKYNGFGTTFNQSLLKWKYEEKIETVLYIRLSIKNYH